MKPVKIAVISDLHVGTNARSRDLCPHPETKAIEDNYRNRFVKFVQDSSLSADFLVCPGDASHRAQPAEFILAAEFIREAAEALGVETDKIVFVPGNHDVNWPMIKVYQSDTVGAGHSLRYHALAQTQQLFADIIRKSPTSLVEAPYVSAWEYSDLLVIGHNSSWNDSESDAVHHGLISDDSIRAISELLERVDLSSPRLRLFLIHHHPIQYSDPVSDRADFSILTNAENLLKLLREKNFDLIIHGHKHNPRFSTHSIDSSSPIAVLGSGSFSAQLDTQWAGEVTNQFHIINVEERDPETNCVCGNVQSWSYTSTKGWKPSTVNAGIQHQIPFGSYYTPESLLIRLRPLLEEILRSQHYVEWKELVAKDSRLRFLPVHVTLQVADLLAEAVEYKRHGGSPDEIILLPKDGKR